MANYKVRKATKIVPKKARRGKTDIFARLACNMASYEFDASLDAFDLAKFHKETGLRTGHRRWSTVFYARNQRSGYHVHFNGSVKGKTIEFTVAYYARSVTVSPEQGPFAETAMAWLGSFFRKPTAHAWVSSRFSKPIKNWRSRFNLPFKVTMAGSNAEVVIDGISLDLPPNQFGAMHGWLNKYSKELSAMVMLARPVTFSTFRIEEELPAYNEALKIFMEEIG